MRKNGEVHIVPRTHGNGVERSLPKLSSGRPTPIFVEKVIKATDPNPDGYRARTLLSRVRQLLAQKSKMKDLNTGHFRPGTRYDDVAEAYVRMMESGSFAHLKEFIDREEGKVPTRIAGPDGEDVKLYIGLPTQGEEAP